MFYIFLVRSLFNRRNFEYLSLLKQHPCLSPCLPLKKVVLTAYVFKSKYLSSQGVGSTLHKKNLPIFSCSLWLCIHIFIHTDIHTHTHRGIYIKEATSVLRCESFHFCSLVNRFISPSMNMFTNPWHFGHSPLYSSTLHMRPLEPQQPEAWHLQTCRFYP